MLLTKMVYVAQFVSDQDKALDFYTRLLDFAKRADNPTPDGSRFLTVAVKGQDLQLMLARETRGSPAGGWAGVRGS